MASTSLQPDQVADWLRAGDVIFTRPSNYVGRMIGRWTWGGLFGGGSYSHVAVCVPWLGGVRIVESTTLATEPCEYAHRQTSGVQIHSIGPWMRDHKRGLTIYRPLTLRPEQTEILESHAEMALEANSGYDTFGAALSWFAFLDNYLGEGRPETFCSKLAAKLLMVAGLLDWRHLPHVYTPRGLSDRLEEFTRRSPPTFRRVDVPAPGAVS